MPRLELCRPRRRGQHAEARVRSHCLFIIITAQKDLLCTAMQLPHPLLQAPSSPHRTWRPDHHSEGSSATGEAPPRLRSRTDNRHRESGQGRL